MLKISTSYLNWHTSIRCRALVEIHKHIVRSSPLVMLSNNTQHKLMVQKLLEV